MNEFPLEITDTAVEALKAALQDQKKGTFIRAAIQGGGCSGLQYKIDFDTTCFDIDYMYNENGLKVAVDGYSSLY